MWNVTSLPDTNYKHNQIVIMGCVKFL